MEADKVADEDAAEKAAREIAPRVAPEGTGRRIYDAAKKGDVAALRPLVQEWSGHDVLNWANPDVDEYKGGYTPLIIGSKEGKVEVVKLLLATPGIDVNKKSADCYYHDGKSALGHAVVEEEYEIAELLSAAGAEGDPTPAQAPAPAPAASAAAPNPYAGRYAGKSDADIAANKAKVLPVADPPSVGPGRRIYDAAKKGDMAALRPLVDEWFAHDVLNCTNSKEDAYDIGYTPLHSCSWEGKIEAVQLLLAAPGIVVNKVDNSGWTAVMHAATHGRTEVVKTLLAAPRIKVNAADAAGMTATMLAAHNGHNEVLSALLAAPGLRIEDKANDHYTYDDDYSYSDETQCKTALGFAKHRKQPETAALLRAAGVEEVKWGKVTECSHNPFASRYASKSQADIAANKAKELPVAEFTIFNRNAPVHVGKQISDAAWRSEKSRLQQLVDEWFAHDVLNWVSLDDDGQEDTPLRKAMTEAADIRLLLAAPGLDVNKATSGGVTALMDAVCNQQTHFVRDLLGTPGIDLNKRVTAEGWAKGKTALGLAMQENEATAAALLRAVGARE